MKNYLFILLLSLPFISTAQDVELEAKNGVSLSYKLVKLKEETKKDVYLITVKAKNTNDYDVFYQAPKNDVNSFFGTVTVRNADSFVYLIGEKSKLSTDAGKLYYLKKQNSMSFDKEFKVAKGVQPIITAVIDEPMTSIADFR